MDDVGRQQQGRELVQPLAQSAEEDNREEGGNEGECDPKNVGGTSSDNKEEEEHNSNDGNANHDGATTKDDDEHLDDDNEDHTPSLDESTNNRREEGAEEGEIAMTNDGNVDDTKKKKYGGHFYHCRSSAVRNIALWRIAFFLIMAYEWQKDQVLTKFGDLKDLELDLGENKQKFGKDRWFAYNQFEWVQDLHDYLSTEWPGNPDFLHQLGYVLCLVAALGKEWLHLPANWWRLNTAVFLCMYLIRFLVRGTNFTNHNYLFPLLMVLTILSGGGHVSGRSAAVEFKAKEGPAQPAAAMMSSCHAAIVGLRAQFAVIYCFASLWKLHADWLEGRICRRIFFSFEDIDKAGGVPWRRVEKEMFPQVFVALAVGGLLLDASMFSVLTFARPDPARVKLFLAFTLMFHCSTTYTMGRVIGYSFPATCISGIFVFLPMATTTTANNSKIASNQQNQHQEGGTDAAAEGKGGGRKNTVISCDRSLVHWLWLYLREPFCWQSRKGDHKVSNDEQVNDSPTNDDNQGNDDNHRNDDNQGSDNPTNDKNGNDNDNGNTEDDISGANKTTMVPTTSTTHTSNNDDPPRLLLPPFWQRTAILAWVVWQVAFPLRMLYVSKGQFPYNRLGYRYSWTMMLHGSDTAIVHHHKGADRNSTNLLLEHFSPTCFGRNSKQWGDKVKVPDLFMPRNVYIPLSQEEFQMQDVRAFPLHTILNNREYAMFGVMPMHFAGRFAAGIGKFLDTVGENSCAGVGIPEQKRMGVHYVSFAKLNANGPFCRLVDPTADLAAAGRAMSKLDLRTAMWNALWDERPEGHEFVLRHGVGSLKQEALRAQKKIEAKFEGKKKVEIIADRAACLYLRPLWLRPMLNKYTIMPVKLPSKMSLLVQEGQPPNGETFVDHVLDRPGKTVKVQTIAMEIGLRHASEEDDGNGYRSESSSSSLFTKPCLETDQEDVLIAIIFTEN